MAFLCGLSWQPRPGYAFFEYDKNGYSIELIGSVRLTGAFLHYQQVDAPQQPSDDGLAAVVLRLMAAGNLGTRVGYKLNIFADFNRLPGTALNDSFATVGSGRSPYRNRYLSWDYWRDGNVSGELGIDRLFFRFDLQPVAISIGRMPINYGVTSFFSPNDFFAPFSATAINKSYKPGVDSIRINIAASPLSSIEVSAVLGSNDNGIPAWSKTALLMRVGTVFWDFEWALIGGKVAERWLVGGSLQGEGGPFGLRAEGHLGFADNDGRGTLDDQRPEDRLDRRIHGRVAAGADLQFEWRNSRIALEVLYLSDGSYGTARYAERYQRLFPDDVYYLGQVYLAFGVGGEILPVLRADLVLLFNAIDYSGVASISLSYNLADEIDFVGGSLLPWGGASEFGQLPITVFFETRFYY